MNLEERITQAKNATQEATTALLATFTQVPDDRLQWSPSPTARTAVQIVAHCGLTGFNFAKILRGEAPRFPPTAEEAAAFIRQLGADVTGRKEAIALVENSTAEILTALDGVKEEKLASTPVLPVGLMPIAVWMLAAADHTMGHSRQIDYLQTIWGDVVDHT